jgi:hypothetical protein
VSILQAFAEDGYRVGDYVALLYDPARVDVFGEEWIADAYRRLKGSPYSQKSKANTTLQYLFCGMGNLSFNAIVSYLSQLKIVVVGKWEGDVFISYGFAFITITTRTPSDAMAFIGYGFFKEAWGCPETELLTMLALCYFFKEFSLCAIHGVRYVENRSTARFMRRFGFKDDGIVPKYMLKGDKLVSAVVSSCLREDFEHYVEEKLISGLSQNQ